MERILPRTLRIRVTEREPVAQVNRAAANTRRRRGGGRVSLDAEGFVMLPLDPRQRTTPLARPDDALPVLTGVNPHELQPGRRVESPQVQAALQLDRRTSNLAHGRAGGFAAH